MRTFTQSFGLVFFIYLLFRNNNEAFRNMRYYSHSMVAGGLLVTS